MIMDRNYSGYSDEQQSFSQNSDEYLNAENGFKFDIPSPDFGFMNAPLNLPDSDPYKYDLSFSLSPDEGSFVPSTSLSPDGGGSFLPSTSLSPDGESLGPSSGWSPEGGGSSASEDNESSDPLFKFISQMLMEENMEDKPHMFYDPFSLKATEKSLYDVIGEEYPPSLNSPHESPESYLFGSGNDYGGKASTTNSTGTSNSNSNSSSSSSSAAGFGHPDWVGENNSGVDGCNFQSNQQPTVQGLVNPSNAPIDGRGESMAPSTSKMVQNMFSDVDSVLLFKRGQEEASKFLPSVSQLVFDLETNSFSTSKKEEAPLMVAKQEIIERTNSPNGSRGRKNHQREDLDLEEERSNKQSAVYVEEVELSEMFDKVLLWTGGKCDPSSHEERVDAEVAAKDTIQDEKSSGSSGGRTRGKKQGKKKETADLRALLILCAQAVSSYDCRTATELLKQIRDHSSPLGDGSQRLAHYFANGLEARLAGSAAGMQSFFTSMTSKKTTAADMLKAYKTQLHSAPYKKISMFFANKMIMNAAEKATTLHIVDFGVLYGFQWPILIQHLSERPGGAPKLRITGIELPQHGFRPKERIEETGRRLAKYCERFSVPFEYNPIAAQDWESIPIDDLKIRSNEVLAVNCLGRFKNLFDETVEVNCPRDAVLNLIRKMNPDIFVHTIINGSYNAPFFLTRFREALFHFSSLFDMFDATLSREDQGRLMFEREFYGREAMNAVACEGVERVDRPETYKQWQARTTRAGFKSMPLDRELMKKFRNKIHDHYHKDFVVDEDNNWLLQGWKGRIIYASSCWVPA